LEWHYVIESDLTLHYQPKPAAAAMEVDFNLARDWGGELLPKSANRYNVAEPQLFVLVFFSVLTVNMLWLWLMPPTRSGMNPYCQKLCQEKQPPATP
jgi:hypothetical protein